MTLYEIGVEGHRALLVSELVAGSTLDELAREGDLCDRDVAELGADICEALEHAHANGVVHRDVKPQNVIVRDEDGAGRRAKLMDFGIAAIAGSATLTATGEVVGTLAYMSPGAGGGRARRRLRRHVYSLALTLYECWAGLNPVRRATPAQTARELGNPLPSLSQRDRTCRGRSRRPSTAACSRTAGRRPPLAELRRSLESAVPRLDARYAVPAPLDVGARRGPRLASPGCTPAGRCGRSGRGDRPCGRPPRAARPRRARRDCSSSRRCCSRPARRGSRCRASRSSSASSRPEPPIRPPWPRSSARRSRGSPSAPSAGAGF